MWWIWESKEVHPQKQTLWLFQNLHELMSSHFLQQTVAKFLNLLKYSGNGIPLMFLLLEDSVSEF